MKYISLLLFILLLCGCKQQELLNHLDQQQANDVLAVLQRHNINAEKKDQGKTGFSIFVEPTDFASAVDWLKIYNLPGKPDIQLRSEEHTSELQSRFDLVCRLLLEKKKKYIKL